MRIFTRLRNPMLGGRPCPAHSETDHHMRKWDAMWSDAHARFERVCPHGVGHPDPGQFPIWREFGRFDLAWHECCIDMCCICTCPRSL